ncbi:MAG: DUF4194 domain-containing protein [Bacteroidales bacterium]|nr:DUF4194 domain-containing protein [Bacteroidales bacterium]
MNMNDQKPYSRAIILLLKKTVEKGSPVWEDIINYQIEIQEYLAVIGLELILKKDEGFAFVKQIVFDDDATLNLVSRRQLGFEVSVIVIVLRQVLEDYDSNPTETQSVDRIITNNEIKDEVRLFLPQNFNKVKLEKDMDTYIQKVVDLGFLKEVKRNNDEIRYKIHRIIKEKVTLEDLDEFKKKLDDYAGTI